jgi:RimJ/RimL family protein N-acetyltransferase
MTSTNNPPRDPQPVEVRLRNVIESDLAIFFEQQLDPESNHMAAFTARDPSDREAFMAHWIRILASEGVLNKTILFNGQVAGYLAAFDLMGQFSVGYWIGKEYWGKGIATRGLAAFLEGIETRPIYARAAKENAGSLRVLEKCGFKIIGEDRGFAFARGVETEEWILRLG